MRIIMDKKVANKQVIIVAVLCLAVGIVAGIIIGMAVVGSNKDTEKKDSADKETADTSTAYDALECIELPDYKNMEVSLAVTQDDIDAEIDSLKEEYTTYEQKTGMVEAGDMFYADVEGYIDGKRIDDICVSDNFQAGDDNWPDEFYNNIVGTKTGNTAKFSITIPDGWSNNEDVDGHKVDFSASVQYICGEEIVPEYNDDFVKSISSDCNTTKEYNKYLKEKLLKENKDDRGTFAWNEILDGSNVLECPEQLQKAAETEVLQGYYDMAEMTGSSIEDIFMSFTGYENEESFKKSSDWNDFINDTVKEYLLAEALAKAEGISYTDADYSNLVEEEYYYNTDKYDSQDKYEEACHDYLERTALHNAVVKWLADNMKYTE